MSNQSPSRTSTTTAQQETHHTACFDDDCIGAGGSPQQTTEDERVVEEELRAERGKGGGGGEEIPGAGGDPTERPVINLPSIPTCLKPIFHSLIGHLLYEDDDFIQTTRKVLMFILLTSGFFQASVLAYYLYHYFTYSYIGDLAVGFGIIMVGVSYLGISIQMRRSKHCSDTLMMMFMGATSMCVTIVHFGSTSFDTRMLDFSTVLVGILLQSPGMPFITAWHAVLIIQGLYVDKYLHMEGAVLPLLPGTRISQGQEPFVVGLVGSLGCGIAVCLLAWFGTREQQRQVTAAQQSVALANQVVAQLQEYNTDKVRDILNDAKGGGGDDDEEEGGGAEGGAKFQGRSAGGCANRQLLQAFDLLVANLEQYRPFLPNYLFLSSSGNDGSSSTVDDDDEDNNNNNNNHHRPEKVVDQEGGRHYGYGNEAATTAGGGRRNSSRSSSASKSSVTFLKSEGGGDDDNAISSGTGAASTIAIAIGTGHGSYHRLQTSFAWVELKCNEWFSLKRSGNRADLGKQQQQNLKSFTDTVFAVAKSSKGSIHSMVGDRVQLSWNATHRVAQPESKAATFLLKLRAALKKAMSASLLSRTGAEESDDGGDGYTFAGACCSGITEIHSAFSAVTKQQALYIDTPWLPMLECCYALAIQHGALVVDSATAAGANYDVVVQGVDSIRYKLRVATTPSSATTPKNGPTTVGPSSVVETTTQAKKIMNAAVTSSPLVPTSYLTAHLCPSGRCATMMVDHESLVETRRSPSSSSCVSSSTTVSAANPMVIAAPSPPPLVVSFAFELLSLKEDDETLVENEWMYQLENVEGKKSSATATTTSLQCAVEGRFGDAVVALEQAEELRRSKRNHASSQKKRNNNNILGVVAATTAAAVATVTTSETPARSSSSSSLSKRLESFCHSCFAAEGGQALDV